MTAKEYSNKIARLRELLGFKIPLDGLMMIVVQRPVIDVIKLNEMLLIQHNYEGSMDDFIKFKFGNEALTILQENTPE